jgi:hypothetical protein
MNSKKNVSSLSDHKLLKKKGVIETPLNNSLRNVITLSSWTKERMPEYLWLGLILMHSGRKEGFAKAGHILFKISNAVTSLSHPKLSMIFQLADNEQRIVYEIIKKIVDPVVLAPLTLLYRNSSHPLFNQYFYCSQFRVEDRMDILSEAVKIYTPHQSNEATDLRFLSLSLLLFAGRLHLPSDSLLSAAFTEYPYTDHNDEKMRSYRPTIRAAEGSGAFLGTDIAFCKKFWRDIGMMTSCNPMVIKFDDNPGEYEEFITGCQKVLEYVLASHKEKSLSEDRFDVIVGSTNFALKVFAEIVGNSLGGDILGRHAVRTIIEIYIMLKYLLNKEVEHPQIWEEYKLYGISKYKLILLKAREADLNKTSHFIPPIADAIVNEIKWEEFIDVDLKYFDKQGIREKSIEVGEKELYDLFYDYDSNFSHGLWGAIRESSMLHCDNATHRYHSIPDIHLKQTLPDVKPDSLRIIKKIFIMLGTLYEFPKSLLPQQDNQA